MNDSIFEQIHDSAKYLSLDLCTQEMAQFAIDQQLSDESIQAIADTLAYLKQKKSESVISTLLRLSRLPLKEPKTFESFDFSQLHGKQVETLKNLASLSALYAHKNLAFIGPQGVGKTHLAMAYGRQCCELGLKAYFLKATELNQRLTDARKYGRESSTINGLVKPSCLIIDEAPVMIPVEKLRPFERHPYKVFDNKEMNFLIDSIQEQGILSPLIVRPIENTKDEYEVVSGHRRLRAAEKAGMKEVPAFIYALDRDAAAIAVVDSNLHREHILPSEKAFAYKMKMDALSHQGKRTDLTSGQFAPKLSTELIGEKEGLSKDTVKRYIRLTHLVPQLLDCMDENRIAFSVGVELSYLNADFQYAVLDAMAQEDCTPSYAQAVRMRKMFRENTLTEDEICGIMCEEKANQKEKVSFKTEDLRRFFPNSYTTQDMEKAILQIVEADYHRRQRNRDRGDR